MDLIEYIENHHKWSRVTFGEGERTKGILEHLRKELEEVEEDPKDLEEWIDIIILGIEGATHNGFLAEEITKELMYKQIKNIYHRKWPSKYAIDKDKPIEHLK